jgi:hypothetical protein
LPCYRYIGSIKIPADIFAIKLWNFKKENPVFRFLRDRIIAEATTWNYEKEIGVIFYEQGELVEEIIPPYQILFTPKKFFKEKIEVFLCKKENNNFDIDIVKFENSIGKIIFVDSSRIYEKGEGSG